ncbi:MAG TPA: copper transporter [Bacilli bacterium]|nr:copper transporter [Bacilli bacterium]
MYGFRYHVMTLIAVFLALGLGLLLGGTLGQEALVKEQVQMLDRLEDRYKAAQSENSQLKKQKSDLQAQTGQLGEVVAKIGTHYVRDRLVGKQVAILNLEPTNLTSLLGTLQQAGAEVTSTAVVTNLDPWLEEDALPAINQTLGLGDNADAKVRQDLLTETIVEELFYQENGEATTTGAFGGIGSGSDSHADTAASGKHDLLDMLQEGNALTVNGSVGTKPDAVILVGGATKETKDRLQHLDVPLIRALKNRGIDVVGVEQASIPLSGVTYYSEAGVSTIDNFDQTTGLVALIDVLGGATGHYGTKKTAQALLPQSLMAKEVSSP